MWSLLLSLWWADNEGSEGRHQCSVMNRQYQCEWVSVLSIHRPTHTHFCNMCFAFKKTVIVMSIVSSPDILMILSKHTHTLAHECLFTQGEWVMIKLVKVTLLSTIWVWITSCDLDLCVCSVCVHQSELHSKVWFSFLSSLSYLVVHETTCQTIEPLLIIFKAFKQLCCRLQPQCSLHFFLFSQKKILWGFFPLILLLQQTVKCENNNFLSPLQVRGGWHLLRS